MRELSRQFSLRLDSVIAFSINTRDCRLQILLYEDLFLSYLGRRVPISIRQNDSAERAEISALMFAHVSFARNKCHINAEECQ